MLSWLFNYPTDVIKTRFQVRILVLEYLIMMLFRLDVHIVHLLLGRHPKDVR